MSKFCPFCGEELVDEAKFCKNCGKDVSVYADIGNNTPNSHEYVMPASEKSHTLATVLGFIFAFLIPILGIIIGIYLLTRKDSSKAKKYGIIVIALAAVVWFVSFITSLFMY